MREFELTLKIRNNLIRARRRAMGLSPKQLGVLCGVSYELVLQYEALSTSPVSKKQYGASTIVRSWRPSARKLASFFGVLPEELWPEAVLAIKTTVLTTEVEADKLLPAESVQLALMPDDIKNPEDLMVEAEMVTIVQNALLSIPKRERDVIKSIFWDGKTLEEAGKKKKLSRERIRQIEARGLRMLRHPSRSRPVARALGRKEDPSPFMCVECAHARAADPDDTSAACEEHMSPWVKNMREQEEREAVRLAKTPAERVHSLRTPSSGKL